MTRRVLLYLSLILLLLLLLLLTRLIMVRNIQTTPWQSTGVTWNNITIGETTEEEVIAELGPPDKIRGHALYYYFDRDPDYDSPGRIITVSRKRVVMRVDDYIGRQREDIYLDEFIDRYGIPDYVTWGYDYTRMVVFLDDGVMLEVMPRLQPEQSWVGTAHYFLPCSLTCIQIQYPFQFADGPTFTHDYGVESPPEMDLEDPWGFTTNGS